MVQLWQNLWIWPYIIFVSCRSIWISHIVYICVCLSTVKMFFVIVCKWYVVVDVRSLCFLPKIFFCAFKPITLWSVWMLALSTRSVLYMMGYLSPLCIQLDGVLESSIFISVTIYGKQIVIFERISI